jgi:hypothetical protein
VVGPPGKKRLQVKHDIGSEGCVLFELECDFTSLREIAEDSKRVCVCDK